MNAQDLRLNNFIFDLLGGVCQVRGLTDKGIWINSDGGPAPENAFNPIPLTDEWLERAGFEMLPKWTDKKRDGATAFLDLGYLNISKNMMGGITLCDNQGLSTGVHIDYVHELQNIHFDLKGTELVFKKIDDNDEPPI